jgi:hypothetical protein
MIQLPNNRDITYFAQTNYRNSRHVFGIKRRDRRQHMYILGKSGTGKSALLSNLLYQDIQHGYGCCIIDPHGDLVEELINAIPEERLDDVVYFNPADTDFHMGFNILEVKNEAQKHLVASGIMGVFTKIWANAWSSRMEYILNNCILALLDTPGTTLLGIQRILVDDEYRKRIVENIKDPVVRTFWVHEFASWQDRYRTEAIAPIQNKVGQFLSTAIIRNILGQQKSTVDFADIMNSEKIFLVNLSKGRIGEGNGSLLGGMIITKLQLAAMERVQIPEDQRKDFYLYVDEFQNFVTESFASILSEARKYRLNLTVAHQYIAQLETAESAVVRDAVFGNVGTMLIYRVGAADADFLEQEFAPEFTPEDFVALPNYHIYMKLLVDGMTTRPFSATTIPPLVKYERNLEKEQRIIERSRTLYHRPRAEVEAEISNWSRAEGGIVKNTEASSSQISSSTDEKRQSNEKVEDPGPEYDPIPLGALGIEFETDSDVLAKADKNSEETVIPSALQPRNPNKRSTAPRATRPKSDTPVRSKPAQAKKKAIDEPDPKAQQQPKDVSMTDLLSEALSEFVPTTTKSDSTDETPRQPIQPNPAPAKQSPRPATKPEKSNPAQQNSPEKVSLKDLLQQTQSTSPRTSSSATAPKKTRVASEEHLSALRNALSRVQEPDNSNEAPSDTEPPRKDTQTPPVPDIPDSLSDAGPPDFSGEIPEDVLRKMLS